MATNVDKGRYYGKPAMERRLTEAARLGFTRCIVPRHSTKQLLVPEGMELIRVRNIREAIEMAL